MRNKKAGLIIFILDLLMMFSAFISSAFIAYYLSNFILSNPTYVIDYKIFTKRAVFFLPVIITILFIFHNRGHYQRRIPWWSQVRYIGLTLIIGFVVEGFFYFAIKTSPSRLWLGVSWVNIFILILFGRFLAKTICIKIGIWQASTILIGSGRNIIQTLFAMDSDDYAGYDVKKIIVTKDVENLARRDLPAKYQLIDIIECHGYISDFVKNNFGYFYILSPENFDEFDVSKVVNIIKKCEISYAMVPPLEGLPIYG